MVTRGYSSLGISNVSVTGVNWKHHSVYLRNEIKKAMKSKVDQLGFCKADIYVHIVYLYR